MKTSYKPTQWRGNRVVFHSLDAAEEKRETRKGWIVVVAFLLAIGVMMWLTHRP